MPDTRKLLIMIAGVVVLAAGGWFAWDTFMAEPPPPPPAPVAAKAAPKPKAADAKPAPGDQDQLVAQVIELSGMGHAMKTLPEQILAGVRQSPPPLSKALLGEWETAVADAFQAEKFRKRMVAELKGDFDAKRLQELANALGKPPLKALVAMEAAEVDPRAAAAWIGALKDKPLAAERVALLKRINDATGSSDLNVDLLFTAFKGVVGGTGDKAMADKVAQSLEAERSAMLERSRTGVVPLLGYLYRDAPDADLGGYAALWESAAGRWFAGHARKALTAEVGDGATGLGKKTVELIAKAKGGAEKPPSSAVPVPAAQAAPPADAPPRGPSRAHEDARDCLSRGDNLAIMRCAEAYR